MHGDNQGKVAFKTATTCWMSPGLLLGHLDSRIPQSLISLEGIIVNLFYLFISLHFLSKIVGVQLVMTCLFYFYFYLFFFLIYGGCLYRNTWNTKEKELGKRFLEKFSVIHFILVPLNLSFRFNLLICCTFKKKTQQVK